MNKNAKRWVAALRSGEYKQTKNKLRSEDAFCCLGVACDLFVNGNKWETYGYVTAKLDREVEGGSRPHCTFYSMPPASIMEKMGLDIDVIADVHFISNLATKNDNGVPFTEIADQIEKYLARKAHDKRVTAAKKGAATKRAKKVTA